MMTLSNGNIFHRYWPFVRGIHRSPMNSPHKGQWRGTLIFSLICAWINDWVNNREAGNLRCNRAHYDITVMINSFTFAPTSSGRLQRWGISINICLILSIIRLRLRILVVVFAQCPLSQWFALQCLLNLLRPILLVLIPHSLSVYSWVYNLHLILFSQKFHHLVRRN